MAAAAVASMAVDGPLPSGGAGAEPREEGDLYTRLKTLQRQLEFLDIQEEYIKARRGSLPRFYFCICIFHPHPPDSRASGATLPRPLPRGAG